MNTINLLCAKLDGLDIGQHEDPPAYDQSYDLIIPLVRKLVESDNLLRHKFKNNIRILAQCRLPLLNCNNAISNIIIFGKPEDWAEAIVNASGIK